MKASLCSLIFLSDEAQASAAVPEQFVSYLLEIEKERDELRSRLETLKDQVHRAKQCRHL